MISEQVHIGKGAGEIKISSSLIKNKSGDFYSMRIEIFSLDEMGNSQKIKEISAISDMESAVSVENGVEVNEKRIFR